MTMQLQKEVISIEKQPSCEKSVRPQNARVKKSEIKSSSQEMAVIANSSMAKF